MKRILMTLPVVVLLAGCGGSALVDDTVARESTGQAGSAELRLGSGYRGSDDPCVRVGNSEAVAAFVSSESDLVGCPIDFEGRPKFIQDNLAREVLRTDGWVVYSVPLFGAIPTSELPSTPPLTGG